MPQADPLLASRGILEKLYLWLHARVYASRLRRQQRFAERTVISIGNLSAGGVGKTPLSFALARRLGPRNCLIALRGYGARIADHGLLAGEDGQRLASARQCGDEALLLVESGARVAAGPNRLQLLQRFAGDRRYVLLDDAFQNPLVARDLELLLIDATDYPQRMRLIPGGRYRDPLSAAARADMIILTRCDLVARAQLNELCKLLRRLAPQVPLLESEHRSKRLQPAAPRGVRFGAFAGLGNNEGFFAALERSGLTLSQRRSFRDHHWYSVADLQALHRVDPQLHWITSEKDMARIEAACVEQSGLTGRLHSIGLELHLRRKGMEQILRAIDRRKKGAKTRAAKAPK
ncbi:MAG: tetraacyldisaccharide 4'-kinase [Leptospirales bacterium]|nr:tetraacyldisaccharide 4'-kinase [Leptospirales bacterium]